MKIIDIESISVGDFLIFEMHHELRDRKLLEDDTNNKEYSEFIKLEKSHTISNQSLINGKSYVPLGLNAAPEGEIIIIKKINNIAEFIEFRRDRLFFKYNNIVIDFPVSTTMTSGSLDTLIFSSIEDQNHFITKLKLRFSTWKIKVDSL